MEYVLCIDLGTYCDNKLMDTAIYNLKTKYKVVCLTDEKHVLSKDYIKVEFKTPSFMITDETMSIADTSRNFFIWTLSNVDKAYTAFIWSRTIQNKLLALLEKYNFKSINIMYPAMGMLWLLPKNIEIPINIYYYSPAIPSFTIPWLFDSKIKEPTYELYSKNNQEYNKGSWLRYYRRIAMLKGNNVALQQTLKKLNHFMCWDKFSVPELDYCFDDLKVTYIGALINRNVTLVKLPKNVQKFIKSKKKIIYMTFGSYSTSEYLQPIFPGLMKLLESYCVENNAGIIYHVPNVSAFNDSDWLLNTTGFLQYEAIVQVSDLVIFTGSLCLQNICLSLTTPMVMVPILTEQYFWSKNYRYFTGVSYIPTDSPFIFNMKDLKKAFVVNSYVKRVGKSMKATDAAQNILYNI